MEHESDKDWHEQFMADCKRRQELAEARLKEIEADSRRRQAAAEARIEEIRADSERRQEIAEAKTEKIRAKSRRKRKIAEAKIKELMTDSEWTEWEREKWYEDSHKRAMRLMTVAMVMAWLSGVVCGLVFAHFLIIYGPRGAGLQ